jgi:hypothetical protein
MGGLTFGHPSTRHRQLTGRACHPAPRGCSPPLLLAETRAAEAAAYVSSSHDTVAPPTGGMADSVIAIWLHFGRFSRIWDTVRVSTDTLCPAGILLAPTKDSYPGTGIVASRPTPASFAGGRGRRRLSEG